ncbi:hypothetical protein KFE98_07540 [bacterium SCSIO 12741]|nr:hypothetical protein KFE98_07540 [bacterium SCSIO 12741]
MELNDQDIAQIEAYLLGECSSEERAALEQRVQSDPEFAAEFQAYQQLHKGIKEHARQAFKANIAAVGAKVIAKGDMNSYKPKLKPGGGGGIGNGIFTIMAIGLVLAVGGYWAGSQYLFPEGLPPLIEQEVIQDTVEVIEPAPFQQPEPQVKYDTQEVTIVHRRTLMITPDGDTVEVTGSAQDAIDEINASEGVTVDSVYTIERLP